MADSLKLSDAQVRAKLSQLKKIGLYNGNLRRKAPTKYGKAVLAKYMDVLEGKAHVVTVKSAKRNRKGFKEAREFSETARVVRNKVVIKRKTANETARYAPTKGDINLTRTNVSGEVRTRTLIKKRILSKADLPKLRANQGFSVPFNRWGEPEYMTFTDADELWALIQQYEGKYKGIARNIEVVTYKSARQKKAVLNDDGGANE